MRILIATCGTSLIGNAKDILEDVLGSNWKDKSILSKDEIQIINEKIYNKLVTYDTSRREYGAEINSIALMVKEEKFIGDKVHLILSDSVEGLIAGEAIKYILEKKNIVKNVEINIIEDLNISKVHDFAKRGLRNLSFKIATIIRRYNNNDIIISPIGGFKAQILIAGIVSQIYKIPAYYLFEGSEKLIEILPLPITLNTEVLKRNIEIISVIAKEGQISDKEFGSYEKRDKELGQFIEKEKIDKDKYVALSPLGVLAYSTLQDELENNIPKNSDKSPDEKKYTEKNKEPHAENLTKTSKYINFISELKEIGFVEQIITNHYNPDNKGDMIRFTKSSNFTEKEVIQYKYNCSQGTSGGSIFITENEDRHIYAALEFLNNKFIKK